MKTRNTVSAIAKTGFVTGHLERLSREAFKENRREIAKLFRGKSGVYVLYNNHQLYYAGKARDIYSRPISHTKNRHGKKWNYISFYLTSHAKHAKELESFIIRIGGQQLKGNNKIGKFVGSRNLQKELEMSLTQKHKDKMKNLILLPSRTSRKMETPKSKGTLSALPFTKIYGFYKNKTFTARITEAGTISVRGRKYKSLSGATLAIVDASSWNGWNFWHYYDENERSYLPLSEVRKKYGL